MPAPKKPNPQDALAAAKVQEEAMEKAAQAKVDAARGQPTSESEPAAPVLTATPPVDPDDFDVKSDIPDVKPPKFDIVNATMKTRKVAKVTMESREAPLFVREWGVKIGFDLMQRVQKLIRVLAEKGVLPKSKEDLASPDMWFRLDGLIAAIADATEDVYDLLIKSVHTESNASDKNLLTREEAEELSLGDLVLLMRAVFNVNFVAGSMGNALAGLTLFAK